MSAYGKLLSKLGTGANSLGQGLVSGTSYLAHGFLHPSATYVYSKDYIRTIGMKSPTPEELNLYSRRIMEHLSPQGLNVSRDLHAAIMNNVGSAMTVQELSRTFKILSALKRHGLKGEPANQLFLGGHFRIEDGAALFKDLKNIPGAEARFSSHFEEIRTKEFGISAGRIIPEILFLETVENDKHCSHFQIEASPWRMKPDSTMRDFIPTRQALQTGEHLYDSIIYFAAKKSSELRKTTVYNRSNYGWSPYADNNPITQMDALPSPNTEDNDALLNALEHPIPGKKGEVTGNDDEGPQYGPALMP